MKKAKRKIPAVIVAPPSEATWTPVQLLNRAVAAGNVEIATQLMALHERWETTQARRAFEAAMGAAKAALPVIVKNREASFDTRAGKTSYRFEDFGQIARLVDPVLAAHGLSYRFRTASDTNTVTVTCIISHCEGHTEDNSLTANHDTSGSKNAVQAIGSTITYLQRYTLKAALGLASALDDDGNATQAACVSDAQLLELTDLVTRAKADVPAFCKYFGIDAMINLPRTKFSDAVNALEHKIAKTAALEQKEPAI